jgi:transcription-repair coupling factor (superfamily II helicase)
VGEAAIHGSVTDVFPPGAPAPLRLGYEGDRLVSVETFDAATQRTTGALSCAKIGAASELLLEDPEAQRFPGSEHRLADFYSRLETIFDYAGGADFVFDDQTGPRFAAAFEQIADAYEARRQWSSAGASGAAPPASGDLYLNADDWRQNLCSVTTIELAKENIIGKITAVPSFVQTKSPVSVFVD